MLWRADTGEKGLSSELMDRIEMDGYGSECFYAVSGCHDGSHMWELHRVNYVSVIANLHSPILYNQRTDFPPQPACEAGRNVTPNTLRRLEIISGAN
jgi:hypothetical protein